MTYRGACVREMNGSGVDYDIAEMSPAVIERVAERAIRRIAPLFPLHRFVAVNPYLGLSDCSFEQAVIRLQLVGGGGLVWAREEFQRAYQEGRLTEEDIERALARRGKECPETVQSLVQALSTAASPSSARIPTLADALSELQSNDWARFYRERLGRFAAGYFDEGQSLWQAPYRRLPLFQAWRCVMMADRTGWVLGAKGLHTAVESLPEDADACLATLGEWLQLDEQGLELYFHRLLLETPGWAGVARFHLWE
ncbi:MAG: DUF2309 family protein, partial [Bdellovibrionales bacterium]|nr:DUF2309 family protein [Bdellovibrionales bacterium]